MKEVLQNESGIEEEQVSNEPIVKSTPRSDRSSRRSVTNTLNKSTNKTPAKTLIKTPVKTPAKTSLRGKHVRQSFPIHEAIGEDPEEKESVFSKEVDLSGDATASEVTKVENSKDNNDKTKEDSLIKSPKKIEDSEHVSTSDLKFIKNSVKNDVSNDQLVMEVDEPIKEIDTDVEKIVKEKNLNGSASSEDVEKNEAHDNGNQDESKTEKKLNQSFNEISDVVPSVKKNQVLNKKNKETKEVVDSINDNVILSNESTLSTCAKSISIASCPSPATDEEASIFKNMKFVLTSATRSKKSIFFLYEK